MEFAEVIKERYSVRDFAPTPIEEEKLSAILEAGRVAPTAANKQPWKVYVICSAEGLEKIRSITRCAFNAPAVLLFVYDEQAVWKSPLEPGFNSGHQDVSIVATHMMLAAWDLGIGSCWVNFFPNTDTAKAFGLPESEKAVLLLPIGYPGEKAAPSPMHSMYKPMEELAKFL